MKYGVRIILNEIEVEADKITKQEVLNALDWLYGMCGGLIDAKEVSE